MLSWYGFEFGWVEGREMWAILQVARFGQSTECPQLDVTLSEQGKATWAGVEAV